MTTEPQEILTNPDRPMHSRSPLQLFLAILLLLLLPWFRPAPAAGGDLEVERQVVHDLRQSQVLVRQMAELRQTGAPLGPRPARLKGLATSLAARRQHLNKKFDVRREVTERINPTALARHARMAEKYQAKISEYLALVDALSESNLTPMLLEEFKTLLDSLAPERDQPLLGALPYRHLNLAGRQPMVIPALTPAFLGGDKTVSGADLAGSPEAPVTAEIVELAESLAWNPVAIHGWVKNNIKTEWYWGSMKGAEETLHQGSGNDADQAALLVALLRAAGFPARFVRGTVEFFPDLSAAENLTGLSGGQAILGFFQKAGIPAKALIGGGRIANLQVEHIWVEAEIPYANYRGVVIDEHGKSWLGLDPSFKVGAIGKNQPLPRPASYDLNTFRQRYLTEVRSATPLEFLREELVAAGAVYEDLLHTRTAPPEELQILPASLQFKTVAVTGEFPSLPDELRHRARFTATAGTTSFFDLTLPVVELATRSIAVIYEPVTVEDQEIINSYGGLANTPAYLVRLRPVLTVDGERLAIGTGGLAVGEDFSLAVELLAPNGQSERLENRLTIGNIAVLGLAAQGVTLPTPIPPAEKTGEQLLHERALDYLDRWGQAEDELAALLGITLARPLPSLVTLGGVVEVVRLLDQPHGFDWKGVYLDADFRAVEGAGGTADDYRLFLQLSGLQGSILENRVFEEGFGVESVSAAKLLALSNSDGLPPLLLDQTNLAAELPALALPANIEADITHAVYQGQTVTIPPGQSIYEDWLGYGYLKENPATGEAGWMLSGEIGGGMTAISPESWPVDYLDLISHPFRGPTNYDPAAACELKVVTASDRQSGTAGQLLFSPLRVMAVDQKGMPVAGVTLNFSVKAGGGHLSAASATTDGGGIASVNLTLGQRITDNPAYWYALPHSWLIGENIVEVVSSTGLRPRNPFTAYALPGEPKLLTISGDQVSGEILSWSTTLIARVEDEYHNAISNVPVSFSLGEAIPRATCALANADSRKGALVATTDACLDTNIPVLGDCGAESLAEQTSELGAVAQVILGGVPDAYYPITIAAKGFPERLVTVTSRPFGNCNGELPPQHDLVIKDINLTDRFGTNLNAAGIGKSIPLLVRMYAVSEEGQEVRKQSNCFPGDTATCPYFVGTRQYLVNNEFSSVEVAFAYRDNADQAEIRLLGVEDAQDKGLFRIANLPVGATAGKKTVTITGSASKKIQKPVNVCGRYGECALEEQISPLTQVSFTKEIFAVDIALPGMSYTIPVDTQGYALIDTLINYTILPADYAAGNAMVLFYQRQPQDEWEPPFLSVKSESRGNGFVTLARGFRFDPDKEYKAQVILNRGSNGGEVVSGEITLQPVTVNLELLPDYNRDGKIDVDDQGKVTSEKPWRFWVNDDDDGGADANGIGSSANDLPSQNKDNRDGRVNGIRDLVDFFPLKLELVQALALLPPGQGYRYFLKDSDAAVAMTEGMAGGTILTTEKSSHYLEDPLLAVAFGALPTRVVDQTGVELSPTFLQAVKDASKAGIVLLEGTKGSTVPLVLEIRDQTGAVVISQAMPLEIVPVEQMYGHKNLRSEAGGAGGELDRFVNFSDPSSPEHYLQVKQPYCMQGVEKNLVWMHGFNVNPAEARGTYAEVFKRFFHAGLMGRFYGVSWFGDPPAPGTPHYHQAVVNAFATAQAFKDFISAIPPATSIGAHSLGNLVVGSAIHDKSLTNFSKYFAIDAAVALEAYGQTTVDEGMLKVDTWLDYWKYQGTDGQGNPVSGDKLLASEWYKLFEGADDNRKALTWRNRLGMVVSTQNGPKVYNFFSSTEDVLRAYPDDDLIKITELLKNLDDFKNYLAISTWVKQEKFKGRRSFFNIATNVGGVASSYCGWSFNHGWDVPKDPPEYDGLVLKTMRQTPAQAALIDKDILKTKPFFNPPTFKLFGADLAELLSPNGSAFVAKNVNEDSGLDKYYTDNNGAHAKVKIKDWLLAEAFPATTLPMGANNNSGLTLRGQNVDMSGVRSDIGGCCKTSEVLWPKSRNAEWWHSDYKDISYQHMFEFYKKINTLTNTQ